MSKPFTRGDYGCEYAADIVELIEGSNCTLGCTHAGTADEIAEFGPGGLCGLLMDVLAQIPVPELRRDPDGITCAARRR